jgi:chaperonin GroEL
MKKKFSLFYNVTENINGIEKIDNSIKITLGPTGKNGIFSPLKTELKLLTSGSLVIKNLELNSFSENLLLKLFEQASLKTSLISGDGSTTTILLSCQLLKSSFRFLANGYNGIFLSNGLKKIAFFFLEKVNEFSKPIFSQKNLQGILKTSIGKKLNPELVELMYSSISKITRDGLILIEENTSSLNEVENVQGIELDKGFASSYFVNNLKNFEIVYEKPYILIANDSISSLNQIRDIIDHIKKNNRPLVIVAENITKEIISTLVLNNIQKKFKIAVIKYSSIKFLKTGILEDLAILTYSNYLTEGIKDKKTKNSETKLGTTKNEKYFSCSDLGQAEKVIIKKEKSTFIISKFSKLITMRKINEINRELLTSETEYEKILFKTRIARLSGNITKLKIGISNQYQIQEERQKIENAISTIKSSLEEGIVPGGGIFYLKLCQEVKNWASLNLLGDEIFAVQIACDALKRPFYELCNNTNNQNYKIKEKLQDLPYPYGYNLITNQISHTFNDGLVDSAKSFRAILWNSFSIIATLITSE